MYDLTNEERYGRVDLVAEAESSRWLKRNAIFADGALRYETIEEALANMSFEYDNGHFGKTFGQDMNALFEKLNIWADDTKEWLMSMGFPQGLEWEIESGDWNHLWELSGAEDFEMMVKAVAALLKFEE